MKSTFILGAGIFFLTLVGLSALGQELQSGAFKRLDTRDEQDLTAQLLRVRLLEAMDPKEVVEADLQAEKQARESYYQAGFGKDSPQPKPARDAEREARESIYDALRLRLRLEPNSQLGAEEAGRLQAWAQRLRGAGMASTINSRGQWEAPRETRATALAPLPGNKFAPADAVPAVVQILQAEAEPSRELMVEWLEKAPTAAASRGLARTALFDVSPKVRERAVRALKARPAEEYRAAVLEGFRHPWPPVAEHAAELLVAVADRTAVPRLKKMLDEPDPQLPVMRSDSTKPWQVQELVRLNHLQNCRLCHATSRDKEELLRGRIPVVGESLVPVYYGGSLGEFVRADVTFLRQDFSIMQPVEKAAPWPTMQRFDFLLRWRDATDEELEAQRKKPANASYPQRDAVLWAIEGLAAKAPPPKAP
jgi:hypothetical protein